jgi:hypothetical protein
MGPTVAENWNQTPANKNFIVLWVNVHLLRHDQRFLSKEMLIVSTKHKFPREIFSGFKFHLFLLSLFIIK